MSTDPRNEIFDLELREWEAIVNDVGDPITDAVRLMRDYDPPSGTLRVTYAGQDDSNPPMVYQRTSVPVHDDFPKPNPDDPDLTPDDRVEQLKLLHVWDQQQKAKAQFRRHYPDFATAFATDIDPQAATSQRDPRQAPNADGNLLWSFMFSSVEQPDVPTGIEGSNPWLQFGDPVDRTVPITIYDPKDSLRFKIMKCLAVAIYQARASWDLVLEDDVYSLERPFADLDIYRAYPIFPARTPGTHIVNIEEQAFLELEDRVRIENLLSESVANQFFEVMLSGWVPKTTLNQSDSTFANTDRVYPFLEAVRGRLGGCALDERHRSRVFRLSGKNNTLMRISPGGGTVNVHEGGRDSLGIPGFFLRLSMFLVEDLADSTYGE